MSAPPNTARSMPIRLAMIGTGTHAEEQMFPVLALTEGVKLSAVCSRDRRRAEWAAARWGAPCATDRWQELIDPDRFDAIVVSATPALHAEVAAASLERGLSVFVEKPPATSLASIEHLASLERDACEAIAFVGFNFRYGASYRKLVETLRPTGAPRSVRARFVSSKPRKPEWGYNSVARSLVFGLGIHAVDLVCSLLGEVEDVSTAGCRLSGNGELYATVVLRHASGAIGVIELGNISNRFEYECAIVTEGGATGRLLQHNRIELTRLPAAAGQDPLVDAQETIVYDWPSRRGGYDRTGYQVEIEAFRDAVATRSASPSGFAACVPVLRLCERIAADLERVERSGGEENG